MRFGKKRRWISVILAASMMVAGSLSGAGVGNRLVKVPDTAEAADEIELQNPRWNTDGTVSTWDCVWFGNHWQEDTNGDGVADYSDRRTPIKWRVLQVDQEKQEALLLADKSLDCWEFHESFAEVTWKNSTIRRRLNSNFDEEMDSELETFGEFGYFINDAFCGDEAHMIAETDVESASGEHTRDKVFLLSKSDVTNRQYGFEESTLHTGNSYTTRQVKNTVFTQKKGAAISSGNENGYWWLRSSSLNHYDSADVVAGTDGTIATHNVNSADIGVRPALKLHLSKTIDPSHDWWSYAGTVSSDGEVHEINPGGRRIISPRWRQWDEENDEIFDCVYFGHYWQWDTNCDEKSDRNDVKCPIPWRVLSVDEQKDDVFLLADICLDDVPYHTKAEEITWENSTIRSWLNGYDQSKNKSGVDYSLDNFYKNAFSEEEQRAIVAAEIDNTTAGGNNTTDKISLLSYAEVNNRSFGFDPDYASRITVSYATNYACERAHDTYEYDMYVSWWLRDVSGSSGKIVGVDENGYGIPGDTVPVNTNDKYVRPVLHMKLSSALWSYAGMVIEERSTPSAIAPGTNRNGALELPQSVSLVKGKSKLVTAKLWGKDASHLLTLAESFTIESADESIVKARLFDVIEHNRYMLLILRFISAEDGAYGETDVTASVSDGSKVSCHVVTEKAKGTSEESSEYDGCYSVVGTLDEIRTEGTRVAVISGGTYDITSDSVLADAQTISSRGEKELVAARVDPNAGIAGAGLRSIHPVKDILRPVARVKPMDAAGERLEQVFYENGAYSPESFQAELEYSCDVVLPYTLSDLSGVAEEDGLYVSFSDLGITTCCYEAVDSDVLLAGTSPFTAGFSVASSGAVMGFSLAPGETKTEERRITASIKLPSPGNSTEDTTKTCFRTVVNGSYSEESGILYLVNVDRAKKAQQEQEADKDYGKALKTMESIVENAPVMLDEMVLKKYFTENERKAIHSQLVNWIYSVNSVNVILGSTAENPVKRFLADAGIAPAEFKKYLMNRLGIGQATVSGKEKNVITFEGETKSGKSIVLKITAEIGYDSLVAGKPDGTVSGNLTYKLSTGESGSRPIIYTGSDRFKDAMSGFMSGQLEHFFKDTIDQKKHVDVIAESLIGTGFRKMATAVYGTGEDAVYTDLKFSITDAMETQEKVSDVLIFLKKEKVQRMMKISIYCPVNLKVSDLSGNELAAIIDDKVEKTSPGIIAYVQGDEKHMLITDGIDCMVNYTANDNGSMTCVIEDYEGSQMVRKQVTEHVPLKKEQPGTQTSEYVNFLTGNKKGNDILSKLRDKLGGVIEPVIDENRVGRVGVTKLSLDTSNLNLNPQESYTLMEQVVPADATNRNVIWSSNNNSVIRVSESGVLYAVGEGEAVIYAVSEDNASMRDSCRVIVKKQGVTITTPKPNVPGGNGTGGSGGSGGAGGSGGSGGISGNDTPVMPSVPSGNPSPTPKATAKATATAAPSAKPGAGVVSVPGVTIPPTKAPSGSSGDSGKDTPSSPAAKPSVNPNSLKTIVQAAVKAGKIRKKGTMQYVVTSSAKNNRTVTIYRPVKTDASSITIPASVKLDGRKYKVTSIYNYAFDGMSELSHVTIGKNVKIIGEGAFAECTSLRFLILPEKITTIKQGAFCGCSRLKYLVIKTEKLKKVGKQAFSHTASKLKVKTPKKKWKAYARLLKKNGASQKALFLVSPAKLRYQGKNY